MRVEDALRDRVAVRVEDGVGGHQVPDVADEHQAAARERERRRRPAALKLAVSD